MVVTTGQMLREYGMERVNKHVKYLGWKLDA
jgi:hypothetical protein